VLVEILDAGIAAAVRARVYMMLLDGLSHSELMHQLENNRARFLTSRA